jgi:hypothetical protein
MNEDDFHPRPAKGEIISLLTLTFIIAGFLAHSDEEVVIKPMNEYITR